MHERAKIAGLVLDHATALLLAGFINKHVLKSVDYPISTGKEAVVFRATTPAGEFLAVKVFKFETSSFVHMMDYVEGDRRFQYVSHRKRELVKAWSRKEYANLQAAFREGAAVPRPVACRENIVIMEFLGEGGVAYALLKDVSLEDAAAAFEQCRAGLKAFFQAGLVHADLSPYNIIVGRGEDGGEKLFFIDVGQAVLLSHPRAREFLAKDCRNIAKFFVGQGVKADAGELLEEVLNSGAQST